MDWGGVRGENLKCVCHSFLFKSAKLQPIFFFTCVYLTFPQSIDYALTLPERITENKFENITRQKPRILSI